MLAGVAQMVTDSADAIKSPNERKTNRNCQYCGDQHNLSAKLLRCQTNTLKCIVPLENFNFAGLANIAEPCFELHQRFLTGGSHQFFTQATFPVLDGHG